jgi:hypothetical protein
MMNRRGLLRMLGSGVAAGATVNPKEIVAEAMSKTGLASGVAGLGHDPSGEAGMPGPQHDPVDDLLSSFWDHNEARHQAAHTMPAHIASKKSWSPAFKQSEAIKEYKAQIDARRHLERNRSLAAKVAKKMGFG